jgi:hypothetical protein
MRLAEGLILALLAAAALNIGFYVQHDASNTLHSLQLRHPVASARMLLTNRQWLLGYATGWIGWGLYIAALCFAPLSLVQATSAGGVGVLAVLAHQLGRPLERREQVGAAVAVVGLVLLGVSLSSQVPVSHRAHSATLLLVVVVGSALAGIVALALTRVARSGPTLGCAAGMLFGVGDMATKGAVGGNGPWFIPVFAACTALGFVALQLAFQRGRVLETAGVSTLVNNLIPIVGGLLVFHDRIPGGLPGVARIASFGAVVIGAVLLARAPDPPPADSDSSEHSASSDRAHAA